MTQRDLGEQIAAIQRESLRRRAAVETQEDAIAFVRDVRDRVQRCFGPWPARTPLAARVTGVVERGEYRVENVLFESRPGFVVTANLYVPRASALPRPGVLVTCGHSSTGKASRSYQPIAQGLAKLGYVALIFDPIGQGERLQYVDEALQSTVGFGVYEHLEAGNQQTLVGESFATWRAWDGIRALDYLLSRPEVDPAHVGITGNSGGGTLATWLWALDDRFTMAAPSCFVTTFRRNFDNELPTDPEQCPPGALALGLDHEDFIAAMAPRPAIVLAKEEDFFDVRGTDAAVSRLRRLYRLLGAESNLQFFTGAGKHGFSRDNREAMLRFFDRATGIEEVRSEPEVQLEETATLWAAPQGQVATLGAPTVHAFTKKKAESLAGRRASLSGVALQRAIRDQLRLPPDIHAQDFRILRTLTATDYPRPYFTTYAIRTSPGIEAIVYRLADEEWVSRPPKRSAPATLYVSHLSSDLDLRTNPWLARLAAEAPSGVLYTCDVRGIGESRPDVCGEDQFLEPYGSDYFHAVHANMLDRPTVGQRTLDVLCVLDWLGQFGHREVHLAARGWGALPATFAALLSDRVRRVTLQHALTSYHDVAVSEHYDWPLSCFAPGVLEHFDLPDCYRELDRTREFTQLEPSSAQAPELRPG